MRTAASPLRGGSPLRGLQEYPLSSTSTLLQEITTLRSRLKDLEDDTKSSVVGGAGGGEDSTTVAMLKKDVAQLEQEKAMQEKDFLNQMTSLQVESKRQVDELQAKLEEAEKHQQSLNAKLNEANKENTKLAERLEAPTDPESFARKLEDVREMHSKEMEQMKENLISADREISENRAEIDTMQEELFELQNHRHALLDEVTSNRMELTAEQSRCESLSKEVEEAKASTRELQTQIELKDSEIVKLSNEVERLKNIANCSQENQTLVQEQAKEVQKHKDEVTRLQQEIETLKSEQQLEDDGNDSDDSPISCSEKAQLLHDMQEIEARLARFHTKLAEKDSKIDSLTEALTHERSIVKDLREKSSRVARSTFAENEPSVAPPPTVKRTTGLHADGSPRTPVSGLVASFERRLGTHGGGPTGTRCVSDDDDDDATHEDIKSNLQNEKAMVVDLQQQLRSEREKLASLQQQLENQPSHEELDRLRSESVYLNVLREDLERRLEEDEKELAQLRSHASSARGIFQEEKKDGEDDATYELKDLLAQRENELQALRLELGSSDSEKQEMVERLRSQIDALQSELEQALGKIETLEQQLAQDRERTNALESVELEFTMAKARHAEMLNQHEVESKALQDIISKLESEKSEHEENYFNAKERITVLEAEHNRQIQSAEARTTQLQRQLDEKVREVSESTPLQKLNEADKEINRLTVELTTAKVAMADMERNYIDKVKGLEREMALIEAEADQVHTLSFCLSYHRLICLLR